MIKSKHKTAPLDALHAMGLDLHEIARETIFHGCKGISFKRVNKWYHEPKKKVKPQLKAMEEAAVRILRKEGRLK